MKIPHTRITTSRLLKVCANLYASMKIWSKILEEHARCLLQASVPNTGIYCWYRKQPIFSVNMRQVHKKDAWRNGFHPKRQGTPGNGNKIISRIHKNLSNLLWKNSATDEKNIVLYNYHNGCLRLRNKQERSNQSITICTDIRGETYNTAGDASYKQFRKTLKRRIFFTHQ